MHEDPLFLRITESACQLHKPDKRRYFVGNINVCFKVFLDESKKIKYVQKLLIIVYRRKRAQIESIVIYRKNNSKEHNNISIEEILSLCF